MNLTAEVKAGVGCGAGTVRVCISGSHTVLEVKKLACESLKLPVDDSDRDGHFSKYCLCSKGRVLPSELTLEECGIWTSPVAPSFILSFVSPDREETLVPLCSSLDADVSCVDVIIR